MLHFKCPIGLMVSIYNAIYKPRSNFSCPSRHAGKTKTGASSTQSQRRMQMVVAHQERFLTSRQNQMFRWSAVAILALLGSLQGQLACLSPGGLCSAVSAVQDPWVSRRPVRQVTTSPPSRFSPSALAHRTSAQQAPIGYPTLGPPPQPPRLV